MYWILLLILQAQGPVIGNASFAEWDYAVGGVEEEFRFYCQATPGVVPGAAPTAVVPSPSLSWPISGLIGQQYCIVTAFDFDQGVESAPSNEVPFFVFPPPDNLRVVVPGG